MDKRKRTRAYRFSGGNPTFPAQESIGAQKVSINQCDETDVSSFVSRSAGAIICCAKFFDAPVDAAHGQTFCLGIADARDDADWRSGMRITLIIALAVASTAITTAHAGSNVCEGTV